MHLSSAYVFGQRTLPRVHWNNDDGTSLSIDGTTIELQDVTRSPHDALQATTERLYDVLLGGIVQNSEFLSPLPCWTKDDARHRPPSRVVRNVSDAFVLWPLSRNGRIKSIELLRLFRPDVRRGELRCSVNLIFA